MGNTVRIGSFLGTQNRMFDFQDQLVDLDSQAVSKAFLLLYPVDGLHFASTYTQKTVKTHMLILFTFDDQIILKNNPDVPSASVS